MATEGERQIVTIDGGALGDVLTNTINAAIRLVPKLIDFLSTSIDSDVSGTDDTNGSIWLNPRVAIPIAAFFIFVFFGTAFIIMAKVNKNYVKKSSYDKSEYMFYFCAKLIIMKQSSYYAKRKVRRAKEVLNEFPSMIIRDNHQKMNE
ncbi:hypothetical protein AK88_03551 [Plasmodium fragile]|uniref:Uncharacterized protein n=1 Tax=Plasmodium fragile TaxID=5857 RepID=A0A0D9QJ60_PLAFR|nr:uncharacterized protein AK88_03551 [Plasmodium fragile]KJP86842.1 hypothetical protein AK88_03551 [Plasmodium fragile]